MASREKLNLYAQARANGLRPLDAAVHAGYSRSTAHVASSRNESRADVQAMIRKLKRGEKDETSSSDDSDSVEIGKWALKDKYNSPLELMLDVMNNPAAPKALRYTAAKDCLPYCHARKEGGKKDERADRADKAGKGKFGTVARPSHLRAVN